MKLVLLFLLPARGRLKAKCTEGGREGERMGRGWRRKGSRGQKSGVQAELNTGGAGLQSYSWSENRESLGYTLQRGPIFIFSISTVFSAYTLNVNM